MAQRINPNILKLKISKGVFNNSHYKNNNFLDKFQEDLYLTKFIEGFYFLFNFYTSEIIINRQTTKININLLMLITNSKNRKRESYIPIKKDKISLLNINKFQNIFLNSINTQINNRINGHKNWNVEKKIFQKKKYWSKYNTIDYLYWNEIK